MGQELSPADLELYRRVDEVLHYFWDPMGVTGHPSTRDEYRGYLPHVFNLLKNDAQAESIAAYLVKIEREKIGLRGYRNRAMQVAQILLDWKKAIQTKYSRKL